ncbi:MAG: indolepyruvate ferredoxin oxidoreductase subunit alpha [Dehalococcoidia bacterium]
MKRLLSGNEAIALGAYHAGVGVATAYPGTPSTEILENLAGMEGVYVEWSTNEKVAMEVGLGASYGGVRTLVSMKHVGLNVAADPFFAAAVTGVRGGLVVVSCDDPGMHSSQNEQDNRHYARFAKVPMLEPSDSQEAYDLMERAFEMSEEFDTPVLIRSTTRISHSKCVVEVKEEKGTERKVPRFVREPQKFVLLPSNARLRQLLVERRMRELSSFVESFPLNEIIPGDRSLGIVAAGAAYQYAREVFHGASFLKLATTYPLPANLLARFASEVEKVVVVEELDPFLEDSLKAMGIPVIGKEIVPATGELDAGILEREAVKGELLPTNSKPRASKTPTHEFPPRPPLLCPGCPHTGTSFALRKLGFYNNVFDEDLPAERQVPGRLQRQGIIATGDIGCYTLAANPPLLALDTTACMGAGIGMAHGLEKAGVANKTVSVIGDSTFLHSGITGLVNIVYNQGSTTVIILDNSTTAMTGHQGHPGTGVSAKGENVPRVVIEDVARGIGVRDVNVVDAFDMPLIEATLKRCVETDEPSVIVVRGDCPLHRRVSVRSLVVEAEKCDGCFACLRLGCPALTWEDDKARIDALLCLGERCLLCLQVCPQDAISGGE